MDILIFIHLDMTLQGLSLLRLRVPQEAPELASPPGPRDVGFGISWFLAEDVRFGRLLVFLRDIFLIFFRRCFLVSWGCFELILTGSICYEFGLAL